MLHISVLVNTGSIILGSILGLWIGKRWKEEYRAFSMQAIGLVTIVIGVSLGLQANEFLLVLAASVAGALIGQWIKIEERLGKIANRLEKSSGQTRFVQGFVTATVLFVVGPMTILGCFQAGLQNDSSLIFIKSLLDGIASIVLASAFGLGVMVAAASVFLIQGLLVSFASTLSFLSDPLYLNDFSGVGGVILLAIGFRLTQIKEIKAGNFLPALALVVLFRWILTFWNGGAY